MTDPVALLQRLLACPSVTPADAGAQGVLGDALEAIGFTVHRLVQGEAPDGPIHNLFAIRGSGGPHLAFAGHTDVVPAGEGWSVPAFQGTLRDGLVVGRGAVDMKGGIAAFVAAAAETRGLPGTLSLIITGDEEGPATHGTAALMRWMAAHSHHPDLILVGEPTSVSRLGDTIKIGRRGSVNLWVEVPGTQGHVAYPHLADNPIPALARIVARLSVWEIDRGTGWFDASNLEVTDLEVGNPAHNIIPGRAGARFNIRFNDLHRGADLVAQVTAMAREECPGATVRAAVSGEAFLTEPGPFSALVTGAVEAVTGLTPVLSTSGGTSDARFLSRLAPTVELGLVNATMHKLDEAVAVADLRALTQIYAGIIRRACA
jgi:succinyl-diaminopimelate desuccinylase